LKLRTALQHQVIKRESNESRIRGWAAAYGYVFLMVRVVVVPLNLYKELVNAALCAAEWEDDDDHKAVDNRRRTLKEAGPFCQRRKANDEQDQDGEKPVFKPSRPSGLGPEG